MLKIFCNLLERGKCFSMKFKNIFDMLVDTSKLNGGLNQMTLRCRFLLTLFCSWLGGVYVSFIVCPHFFSASWYSNLVFLNISALEEFRGNLSLIIFVSCHLICGGWFDDTSMYINWSLGFLYVRYVLFSKLNVTSKKSISVRLVTILKDTDIFKDTDYFLSYSICLLLVYFMKDI